VSDQQPAPPAPLLRVPRSVGFVPGVREFVTAMLGTIPGLPAGQRADAADLHAAACRSARRSCGPPPPTRTTCSAAPAATPTIRGSPCSDGEFAGFAPLGAPPSDMVQLRALAGHWRGHVAGFVVEG
jgi:hypothetical protein